MPENQSELDNLGALVPVQEHRRILYWKPKVGSAFAGFNDNISTSVSARKIRDARGTRGKSLAQKDVMGGVSATRVRPSKLRWSTERRLNLHRLQKNWIGTWPRNGSRSTIYGPGRAVFQLRFV